MTDIFLPVSLDVASIKFRYLDTAGVSSNALTGAVRSASRGGDKLGASLTFSPAGGGTSTAKMRRAQLISLLAQGTRNNRYYLYDPGYTLRGSFPATELFTNNDFSSGTTGWTAVRGTLSAADRTLRITNTKSGGADNFAVQGSTASVTQYAPYVLRSFISAVSKSGMSNGLYIDSAYYATDRSGLVSLVHVPLSTAAIAAYPGVFDGNGNVSVSGDYAELSYSSFARCILADNGPNALTYSDQIDNAAWSKAACSTTANNHTAPDGTATAEKLTEDTSTGAHYFTQGASRASVAADLCTYGYFAASVLDRDIRLVAGNDASNYSVATFDISAGTVAGVSNVGTATNGRAFIVSVGSGWYFCCLISRAVAASTILAEFDMVGGGSTSYTGTTGALAVWRCGAAVSSVPTRGAQTTTTAAASGATQSGSRIYVKGLPVSTSGLLLPGDWAEVTTSLGPQLCMVVASLDSDAAGLGVLNVSPPVRGTVADGAEIIVNRPMGRFVLSSGVEWMNEPGIFTTASAEFEEAPA